MVGGDGLEPPKTEVGRFTVSCNSRYANRPKIVLSLQPVTPLSIASSGMVAQDRQVSLSIDVSPLVTPLVNQPHVLEAFDSIWSHRCRLTLLSLSLQSVTPL